MTTQALPTAVADKKPQAAAMPATKPDADNNDDEEYTPPPREGFHFKPELCREMLRTVTASVPLQIRSSTISMGSGLFVVEDIDAGHEIYRTKPLMAYIDAGHTNICHYCLETTTDVFGATSHVGDGKEEGGRCLVMKTCSGCHVARFCSKKCQRVGWTAFHKNECKILKENPGMRAEHVLVHRLIFWQKRKFITTTEGRVVEELENHFIDYSNDEERINEIFGMADAVREVTKVKVNMGLVWRLIPAMRTNCVQVREAARREPVGAAYDAVTSTINHSCDPNAFVLFEGNQLRIRSLKKIAAGEEITISYVDPTFHRAARQEVLQHKHFFECRCTRCKLEHREEKTLLKTKDKITALHQCQRKIITLMKNAVFAANKPGFIPWAEDLDRIETDLRSCTASIFEPANWPDHLAPLPAARLCLATLYLEQEKLLPALRYVLQGKLMSQSRNGPNWVTEMMEVMSILIVVGNIALDSGVFADKTFPNMEEIHDVAYGYLYGVCKEAGKVFGGDSKFTKGVGNVYAGMVSRKSGDRPGSQGFEVEFREAQKKLLAWAGVPEEFGLTF